MLAEANDQVLDLRQEAGQAGADLDKTLRIGRLQKLQRLGLAKELQPGVWFVSERTEAILRALGERNDIIKGINRALGTGAGADRHKQITLKSFEPSTALFGCGGRISASTFGL